MMRSLGSCLLVALVVLMGAGCRKTEPVAQPPTVVPQVDRLVRLHWVGTSQLKADTNSAYLMSILSLPEARKLGDELLAKLERAPWVLALGTTNLEPAQTNAAQLLQPLLKTLLDRECYLELQQRTNEAPEFVLAIKLAEDEAGLWETNLGAILSNLPGFDVSRTSGSSYSWSIKQTARTNFLSLNRGGTWTFVTFGPETNQLGVDFVARVQRDGVPFAARPTNYWFEAEVDLPRLLFACGLEPHLPLPGGEIEMATIGDGEFLRTHGRVSFSQPLNVQFEPWNIPTNMIREPLVSFGAFQGVRPWLARIKWLQDLQVTNLPNQFFTWAIGSSQVHTFAATPLPDAAAVVDRVGQPLEQRINSWLTNNALSAAEFSKENHGISWVPVPLFTPTFQALPGAGGGILFGRLAATLPPPGRMAPPELLQRLTSRTNVLYYDWEITESRINQWIFMGQSARVAFRRAQMPANSIPLSFLKAAAPKLGNTVTEVLLTDPSTVSFVRKSHLGLTGLELHLLADWFESPTFPKGFHTLLAQPESMLRYNAKTRTFQTTTNTPARN